MKRKKGIRKQWWGRRGGEESEERGELCAISRIELNLVACGAISSERLPADVLRRIIDGSQFAGTNRSNVSADVHACVHALRVPNDQSSPNLSRVYTLTRADQDHASPIALKITARELVSREYIG